MLESSDVVQPHPVNWHSSNSLILISFLIEQTNIILFLDDITWMLYRVCIGVATAARTPPPPPPAPLPIKWRGERNGEVKGKVASRWYDPSLNLPCLTLLVLSLVQPPPPPSLSSLSLSLSLLSLSLSLRLKCHLTAISAIRHLMYKYILLRHEVQNRCECIVRMNFSFYYMSY